MPTTIHHIKVTWPGGTTSEWTTTGTISWTADEVSFTDEQGHAHKIRRANTGDIETWDSTSP